uniref:Capsular polysaccharide biosynthesis protein n=1 Tax=Streptomyces sp. FR1 TaxID=349971 RepID=V9Z3W7_9ACTN|nr:phenylacetate--CoA ligase family protein [Streptomyces sp. FR1]AHE38684.1 Capsular polysaccharide biosynthesis protein [Streptomyces sp. FR1]
MSGHKWWHNQSLRTAIGVAGGWQLFQELYDITPQDRPLLDRIRRTRLADSLTRAASTEHFASLLSDRDLSPEKAEAVLGELPVLEKTTLRDAPNSLRTGLVAERDELRVRTSGTTGEPVAIAHDASLLAESTASNLRMLSAYGMEPGLRILRLTADTRHALTAFETLPHFGAASVLRINVATIGPSDTAYVDRLCADFRPHMIWGQPLEVLLAVLRQREELLHLPTPRLVLTHGDTLDRSTREAISTGFDCAHRDVYGLQEFGRVAWECPEQLGTYHLDEERVDIATDEHSQLLITSLTNTAMSLLRYRPGDCGEVLREGCPCGRAHARITGLEGRQRGLVIDADGALVGVKPLRLALERQPLDRWQVRQEEPGRLEVLIAPRDMSNAKDLEELLVKELSTAMHLADVRVRTVVLQDLASRTGKAPHFQLLATQQAIGQRVAAGEAAAW